MAKTWQSSRQDALGQIAPFLDLVYSNLTGMLAIVTKDEYGKLNSERWFSMDQLESAIQYCSARWDEDVYFSVSTFPPQASKPTTSSRVSTPESRTNVVYADADACEPGNFRLTPSVVLETSPGRWHCLWVLNAPEAGQKVAELSAKVSLAHAAQGCDKHARDTKILRVPGTTNTKYEKAWTVTSEYTGVVYTYDEFAAAYEDVVVNLPTRTPGNINISVYTPDQLDTLKRYADAVWARARQDLDQEAEKGWNGDGWDNTAYRVACTLARAINTPWARRGQPEAVMLMDESKMNDGAFHAASKLDRAIADVGSDMLHLPEWAEAYQTVELPVVDEALRGPLEERIERAGFNQTYTSVPPNRDEAHKWVVTLIQNARDAGFTNEEVYAIVQWASVFNMGVFTREGLWLYLTGMQADDLQAVIDNIPLPQGGVSWHNIPPILTEAERSWCLANPAFPDVYTAWVASTNTDAASVYSRTLAFVLLSCVYGDIGFLRDPFDDSKLNLYAMVCGDSTLTRKTVALKRMMRVIEDYEMRSGRTINLTSNATAESLNRALAQANGETRIMWTDEIQSFLEEISTKKYLSGFLGNLAKLYDGKVEASLRVGQNNGNTAAELTFNFVGTGIRKHIGDTLTTKNYESGFIPRFVWAIADPPPFSESVMEIGMVNMAQREQDEFNQYSTTADMCNRFIKMRRMLDEAASKPVILNEAATARFNEFSRMATAYLAKSGQQDYLITAMTRLGASLRKAAALLAMHDGTREVGLEHMLHALRQGEYWLRDMVRMANEVAASDFDRQVDEMEQFIVEAKNHQRGVSELRNRFRGLRFQDFNELLLNLTGRGKVKYDRNAETVTAFIV